MNKSAVASERLAVLFLFGIMVLSPPFLFIFDRPVLIAGIPVLYLYLFTAWAVLIVLLAFASELSKPEQEESTGEKASVSDRNPDDLTTGG